MIEVWEVKEILLCFRFLIDSKSFSVHLWYYASSCFFWLMETTSKSILTYTFGSPLVSKPIYSTLGKHLTPF